MIGNRERAWRADVVEAYGAEGGRQGTDGVHDLDRILHIKTYRECVDTGESLEEHTLPFEDWERGFGGATLTAKQIGPVCHDGDGVAATGEIKGAGWIGDDLQACFGNTGCVDEAQHRSIANRHLAAYANKSLKASAVI
jgi:hypothetical protein